MKPKRRLFLIIAAIWTKKNLTNTQKKRVSQGNMKCMKKPTRKLTFFLVLFCNYWYITLRTTHIIHFSCTEQTIWQGKEFEKIFQKKTTTVQFVVDFCGFFTNPLFSVLTQHPFCHTSTNSCKMPEIQAMLSILQELPKSATISCIFTRNHILQQHTKLQFDKRRNISIPNFLHSSFEEAFFTRRRFHKKFLSKSAKIKWCDTQTIWPWFVDKKLFFNKQCLQIHNKVVLWKYSQYTLVIS